jgi:aspartyl-tRNA(Asn)/glutamyl-tRNA(Gln) amidotransferase subunit A
MKDLNRREFIKITAAGVGAAGLVTSVPGFAAETEQKLKLPQTITEAGRRFREGSLTSEALTKAYLAAIKQVEPKLNMFITLTDELALRTARARDAELKAGINRGPLHGIPIVYKDLYDTAGIRTTVGSEFFKARIPKEDATVVRKLNEAGVVMLGKTNMNEFAAGVSGTNQYFGDTHNPWDLDRAPGGSSSGTGTAIAAGVCLGGTGSDTGGSIRVPASWLNIMGIRPSYGRLSVKGAYPRAYSLDVTGPLARTVEDLAILLNAMAGYDPGDPYSLKVPEEDFTAGLNDGIRGLRLGIIENYTFRDVDPEIADAVRDSLGRLASLGAEIKTVDIGLFGGPLEYGNLFNIILYEFNQILGDLYRAEPRRKEVFGPIVQGNIARGMEISKETYEKAITARPRQVAQIRAVFREVDALITPTMPTIAPLLVGSSNDYERGRQFTLPISFTRFPAVSVPCGFSSKGMPIGLQIVVNDLQEALLLRIAAALQNATQFHTRKPKVHIGEYA